jgi:Raf kinase inhibitor-like YbhB/YbcL family protein
MKQLTITSPVFKANQSIPKKYTCNGEDTNPPLSIEGVPPDAKSLALILEDPDAPSGTFDHWVVWNIPPSTSRITEGMPPGREGVNSGGEPGYSGPCPPSGKPHRYIFRVLALDTMLELDADSAKRDLEKATQGHILAEGSLTGIFSR